MLKDALTITVEEAKTYCAIDHDIDDAMVAYLVDSSLTAADVFLGREWLDEESNPLPVPEPIRLWCLQYVARFYSQRINGLQSEQVAGAGGMTFGGVDYSMIWPYRKFPKV